MQKALNPEIGFEVDDNYSGHCPGYYVLKVSVVVDVFVDGRCLEKVLQEGNNTVVFEKVESMVFIYVDKIVAADHQMMQVTFCTYGWCNRCLCNSEPSRVYYLLWDLKCEENATKLLCGPRNIFGMVGDEDQFIFGVIGIKLPVYYLCNDGVNMTLGNIYQATNCHVQMMPDI